MNRDPRFRCGQVSFFVEDAESDGAVTHLLIGGFISSVKGGVDKTPLDNVFGNDFMSKGVLRQTFVPLELPRPDFHALTSAP